MMRCCGLATQEWRPSARLLDIGCGAGRDAVPLARAAWNIVGTDLSWALLTAAAARAEAESLATRLKLLLAPMDNLPFASNTFDFVVAHGIWNLARLDPSVPLRELNRPKARFARPVRQ